MQVYKTIFF